MISEGYSLRRKWPSSIRKQTIRLILNSKQRVQCVLNGDDIVGGYDNTGNGYSHICNFVSIHAVAIGESTYHQPTQVYPSSRHQLAHSYQP